MRTSKAKPKLKKRESVYKDGFRYRYIDDYGRERSVYAKTLPELRKKYTNILKEAEIQKKKEENMTLGEALQRYLDLRRGLSVNSRYNYQHWINNLSSEDIMYIKITKLKSRDIKRWIVDLSDRGFSQSTINGYISGLIKPALNLAVEDELIDKNPASFVIAHYSKKDGRKMRGLTPEEQQQLRDFLKQDRKLCDGNRDYILLCLNTGLRVSELSALTAEDIDLDKRRLRVNKQTIDDLDTHFVRIEATKNGSDRYVPLNDEAYEIAKKLVENANYGCVVDGYTGFLFTDRRGLPPKRTTLGKRYKNFLKAMDRELGTNLSETSIHGLRHTFCTNLINGGANVKTVQYLMGHKNASTTLNTYTDVNKDLVNEAIFGLI